MHAPIRLVTTVPIGTKSMQKAKEDVREFTNTLKEDISFDGDSGELKVDGCSYFDNIEICVNTISATNTNGDINLVPNGYGKLYVDGAIINTASTGNFSSKMLSGSFNVSAYESVSMGSSHSGLNLSSFSDTNLYTLNGDINLTTEVGNGVKIISGIDLRILPIPEIKAPIY
jgi:hypothetical protein